ncbi:ATP-binding protein [Melioribacteraceae bacterium 4301-Me]|uniref:sensor histidine kinase n=1 Tax=Pyranulibacter aquaticus TaxID=3163344 RepID=UPI003596D307
MSIFKTLLSKWHSISVEKKIIATWLISLCAIVILSSILYFSKQELYKSSKVVTDNAKLRSETQAILKTLQKLEIYSKNYLIAGSKKDSINYFSNLDSLLSNLRKLEALINNNPRFLKFFTPLAETIRKQLYKLNHLSFSLNHSEVMDLEVIRLEENVYKKLDNYWQMLDDEEEKAALEQIQSLQYKVNKNLTYFVILILIYIILLTTLFIVIILDVRKRRKLAVEIARSKNELETIINTAPALIYVKNLERKFTLVNTSFLHFFNITKEKILSQTNEDLISKNDRWLADEEDNAIIENKITLNNIEREIQLYNGIKRWLNINKAPLIDENNEVIGIVGVMDDITQRIEFQNSLLESQRKLEEVNNQKDKLFSIVAHDLRSPFYSLLGFTQLLRDEFDNTPDEEKKEYIDNIAVSLKNLLALIDNLLTWARINMNKVNFEPDIIYLDYVIKKVIDSLKFAAHQKSISIINNCPPEQKVYADSNMIETVIRNLVSNAIKFTHENGKVEINVKDQKENILIEIKDNGIGMDETSLSSLFQNNSNRSSSGTKNEQGTGLGLIICKEFIEKNNGKLNIQSKVGEGSTFSFTLPKNNNQQIL